MRRSGSVVAVAAAVLAISIAACGGAAAPSSSGAGSCREAELHACVEWNFNLAAAVEEACTRNGGAYAPDPCPAADRLGRCALLQMAGTTAVVVTTSYYVGVAYTADELRQACEAQGTGGVSAVWTPG